MITPVPRNSIKLRSFCFAIVICTLTFSYTTAQNQVGDSCITPLQITDQADIQRRTQFYFNLIPVGILATSLSPEGDRLAVTSQDGLFVLEAESLEEITSLERVNQSFGGIQVAWSTDGNFLATYITPTVGILIWDVEHERISKILVAQKDDPREHNFSLVWSPNNQYLVTVGTLPARVWDVSEGEVLFEAPYLTYSAILGQGYFARTTRLAAWSPDSHYLAIPNDNLVRVYDTTSWEEVQTLETELGEIFGLDWSSTGILAAIGQSQSVGLWDTSTWQTIASPERDVAMTNTRSLRWSPDGSILALGTSEIELWNIANDELVGVLPSHETLVYDLEWTPDGLRLISRSIAGIVYVWDVERGCVTASLVPELE
jgi:WD40 repeat protein